MDVDRAQILEQYRAKLREHREVELRYVSGGVNVLQCPIAVGGGVGWVGGWGLGGGLCLGRCRANKPREHWGGGAAASKGTVGG